MYETNIVNRLNKEINFKAQRFAEGGSKDLGDIQLFVKDEEYFLEAKSRQNLNIHQSLEKAIEKSGDKNTVAAKIGQPALWEDRVNAVRTSGIAALSDAVMERWFGTDFRATPELAAWKNMLERQPDDGYIGCCQAISGTDFYTPTSGLRLPTLGIAGSEDGSTPPDLVRETVELIPASRFELIRLAGHLPCVENPAEYARILTGFMTEVGHA